MAVANYQQLATLLNRSLAFFTNTNPRPVQDLVNTFLSNVSEENYVSMVQQLDAAVLELSSINNSFRILVATSDGTVAYDASKGSSGNTWAKFGSKTVNSDNHNTRPEIMLATLSSSGTGLTERYSSSLDNELFYNALRLGASSSKNIGTYRVSTA